MAGISKDIERVARMMEAQKLDPIYIRHYLQETYGLDEKSIDGLFEKLGIGKPKGLKEGAPVKKVAPENKLGKSKFY